MLDFQPKLIVIGSISDDEGSGILSVGSIEIKRINAPPFGGAFILAIAEPNGT